MKRTSISLFATAVVCLIGPIASVAAQQVYYTQQISNNCPHCYSTAPQYYQTSESVSQPVDYDNVVSNQPTTVYQNPTTYRDSYPPSASVYGSGYSTPNTSSYRQSLPTQTVSYSGGSGNYYASTNPTSGLAQQKAAQAASMSFRNHVGGGMGGAKFEGVGWSNQSPQKAIENCCHWGQRTPAQIGISKSPDGCWYACVLYH